MQHFPCAVIKTKKKCFLSFFITQFFYLFSVCQSLDFICFANFLSQTVFLVLLVLALRHKAYFSSSSADTTCVVAAAWLCLFCGVFLLLLQFLWFSISRFPIVVVVVDLVGKCYIILPFVTCFVLQLLPHRLYNVSHQLLVALLLGLLSAFRLRFVGNVFELAWLLGLIDCQSASWPNGVNELCFTIKYLVFFFLSAPSKAFNKSEWMNWTIFQM